MKLSVPEKLSHIFQVYYQVVKPQYYISNFLMFLFGIVINLLFIYLGILSKNQAGLYAFLFILLIFNIYYYSFVNYINSSRLETFFKKKHFATFSDALIDFKNDIDRVLLFPAIVVLLLSLVIFINIIISLLGNIPYAGSFLMAFLLSPSFILSFISVIFIFLMLFYLDFFPILINKNGYTTMELIKTLSTYIHYSWPKIIVMKFLLFIVNIFLSTIIFTISILSFFASLNLFGFFSDYQFPVMLKALPGDISGFLNIGLKLIKYSINSIQHVPDYYRVSSIIFLISIAIITVFILNFTFSFKIISNYYILNIIKKDNDAKK